MQEAAKCQNKVLSIVSPFNKQEINSAAYLWMEGVIYSPQNSDNVVARAIYITTDTLTQKGHILTPTDKFFTVNPLAKKGTRR
jgi:hypothetical protein